MENTGVQLGMDSVPVMPVLQSPGKVCPVNTCMQLIHC